MIMICYSYGFYDPLTSLKEQVLQWPESYFYKAQCNAMWENPAPL